MRTAGDKHRPIDLARRIWKNPIMSRNERTPSTLLDVVSSVIATAELPALGPEVRPNVKSPSQLQREFDLLFSKTKGTQPAKDLIRAAALLWHDHLDAAHSIVQDAPSAEAAFIHGIMHRRESDYSNAKYWFDRVGRHATFPKIAARVEQFLSDQQSRSSSTLVRDGMWQPMNFIEACEEAAEQPDKNSDTVLLQHLQQIEFETLLEHLCVIAVVAD